MTRIKFESSVPQVGTSDLQNAENVRSDAGAGRYSERCDEEPYRSSSTGTSNPGLKAHNTDRKGVIDTAANTKLSEGNLQANARAAEL